MDNLFTCEDAISFIVESRTVGYAIVDKDGIFLRISDSYCRFLNAVPQQILGTHFQTWTHPDDLEADMANLRLLLEGVKYEYQFAKRYIQRGSTPKAALEIWGLLEVRSVWKDQTFQYFMVSFTPWTQSQYAINHGTQTLLTAKNLKDAVEWITRNWKLVLTVVAISTSIIWGSSDHLLSILQQAQKAKDGVDTVFDGKPLDTPSGLPAQ